MANEFELSPKELKRQADALLAAADAAEKAAEREPAARSAKKSTRKKGEETAQEAPAVMTDEEARKAGILRLDDKQVAALPAASWLMNNEKLRELLARPGRVFTREMLLARLWGYDFFGDERVVDSHI